jgi:hypothetical protein
MNNVPFTPRNRAGRKLHDLARRHVRDDHDLRAAVLRTLAERNGSAAPLPRDWTRPALDTRRRIEPAAPVDHDSGAVLPALGGPAIDGPTPLPHRRWVIEPLKLVAALLGFALIGGVLILTVRDAEPQDHTGVPGAATASPVDGPLPLEGTLAATITVSRSQWRDMVAGDSSLWLTNSWAGNVERVDPDTQDVLARIWVGIQADTQQTGRSNVLPIAFGAGSIWVAATEERTISRIDPATNTVSAVIQVDAAITSLTANDTGVWAGSQDAWQVIQIDPATNTVVRHIELPGRVSAVQVAGGSVWAATGRLRQIDPGSGAETSRQNIYVSVGGDLTANDAGIWVMDSTSVYRVSATTGELLATITPRFGRPVALAVADTAVWIVLADANGQGHLERIDPTSNTVVARSPDFALTPNSTSQHYTAAVVEHGIVWVIADDRHLVGIAVRP